MSGRKKKKRSRNTKAAKRRLAKRKARQEAVRKRKPAPRGEPGLRGFIQSGVLDRWLAHGANFLSSDYDKGEWNPLFEEVYKGEGVTPEAIQKRVLTHFWIEEEKTISDRGALVGAWATLQPAVAYYFYRRTLDLLAEAGEENPQETVWSPHHGIVWEHLHGLGLEMLAGSANEV